MKDLMKVQEVAVLLDVSVPTINNWYKFKTTNPDHELSKLLPDFIQEGSRQTRKWRSKDMWKMIEFKQRVPRGRAGVMAEIHKRRES